MEDNVVDTNNEPVDLNTIITMVVQIVITGENGTERYFLYSRQYQYTTIEQRGTYYDFENELRDTITVMNHYKVEIDDEAFWIPESFAVIENKLRPEYEQDYRVWQAKKADQPKDFRKEYKKVTGIDLLKRTQEQHDGLDLWKEHEKSKTKRQKIPYRIEQDEEHESTY